MGARHSVSPGLRSKINSAQKCEHGPSASLVPRGFRAFCGNFCRVVQQIDERPRHFDRRLTADKTDLLNRSAQICNNKSALSVVNSAAFQAAQEDLNKMKMRILV